MCVFLYLCCLLLMASLHLHRASRRIGYTWRKERANLPPSVQTAYASLLCEFGRSIRPSSDLSINDNLARASHTQQGLAELLVSVAQRSASGSAKVKGTEQAPGNTETGHCVDRDTGPSGRAPFSSPAQDPPEAAEGHLGSLLTERVRVELSTDISALDNPAHGNAGSAGMSQPGKSPADGNASSAGAGSTEVSSLNPTAEVFTPAVSPLVTAVLHFLLEGNTAGEPKQTAEPDGPVKVLLGSASS